MIKVLIKTLSILLLAIIVITLYLSFFGISTKQFNNHIKSQILNKNKNINLELKTVKILLNLNDLTFNIKTIEPKILIDNNELELESIKTNISLKVLVNREFSIDDLEISTKAIKLNDLILLARSFKNSPQLFILDNIVNDGYLVGDINLNFDVNGKVKDDYEIKGFIKKGELSLLKKYSINNLNLYFNIKHKKYHLENVKTSFNKIELSSPSIKIEEKNKKFLISGKLVNDKKNINIKLLNDLFGYRRY